MGKKYCEPNQMVLIPGEQEVRRSSPREGGHGDEVRQGGEGGPGPETRQGELREEAEGSHKGGRPAGAAGKPAGSGERSTAAAV